MLATPPPLFVSVLFGGLGEQFTCESEYNFYYRISLFAWKAAKHLLERTRLAPARFPPPLCRHHRRVYITDDINIIIIIHMLIHHRGASTSAPRTR